MYLSYSQQGGPGQRSRYSDSLQAERSGDRIPWVARFSAPTEFGSGAHPAPCTIGSGLFLGGKAAGAWSGVDHPNPFSSEVKERVVILLLPLLSLHGLF